MSFVFVKKFVLSTTSASPTCKIMNDKPHHHHPSGTCSLNPFASNFCRNCALGLAAKKCTNAEWCADRQSLIWEQKIKPPAKTQRNDSVGTSSSEGSSGWEVVDVDKGGQSGGRKRGVSLVPEKIPKRERVNGM